MLYFTIQIEKSFNFARGSVSLKNQYPTHFPISKNRVFFRDIGKGYKEGGVLGVDYWVQRSGLSSRFSSLNPQDPIQYYFAESFNP
jgi:hypothetical protein